MELIQWTRSAGVLGSANPSYFDSYTNLALSRDVEGVLTVRFHTDGGPVVFTGQTHEDLPHALEEIALDSRKARR